jgi:predicted dienelactone hydrolase
MKTVKTSIAFNHITSLAVASLSALLLIIPAQAAEKIHFKLGTLVTSLRISSLETFAQTGTIDRDLKVYFKLAKADEALIQRFRQVLTESVEINPDGISHAFQSDIGADVLNHFGKLVQVANGGNGKDALQAGLVRAAASSEGLNLLSFLQKLPEDVVIDLNRTWALAQEVQKVVDSTKTFTVEVDKLSAQEAAAQTGVDFASRPDLRKSGAFGFQKQRLTWQDARRNRQLFVELYRPQQWRSRSINSTPTIVFSHGLASNPDHFAILASHLASHGYVVAVPQHPGSDSIQAQNFRNGLSEDIFLTTEFIERPRDISFVIDELERRNQSEFGGRLNLNAIGVGGHSFGGYTAFAVAGAKIDFTNLSRECKREFGYLNTSLLLQCQALNLPRRDYRFRDERVKALLVINPVNSSVFGPKGLAQVKIPILIGAGSYDPATPFVFEQARSFPWLTTPNKYLALAEGQAHVNIAKLDAGITQVIESVPGLTLPGPDLLKDYADAMSLAFFEVHLLNDETYRPFLSAAYAAYLGSQEPFQMDLISATSSSSLKQKVSASGF